MDKNTVKIKVKDKDNELEVEVSDLKYQSDKIEVIETVLEYCE